MALFSFPSLSFYIFYDPLYVYVSKVFFSLTLLFLLFPVVCYLFLFLIPVGLIFFACAIFLSHFPHPLSKTSVPSKNVLHAWPN